MKVRYAVKRAYGSQVVGSMPKVLRYLSPEQRVSLVSASNNDVSLEKLSKLFAGRRLSPKARSIGALLAGNTRFKVNIFDLFTGRRL